MVEGGDTPYGCSSSKPLLVSTLSGDDLQWMDPCHGFCGDGYNLRGGRPDTPRP